MSKNIFVKYLLVSTATIVLSFVLLGVSLLLSISNYWKNEKQNLLFDNANNAADSISLFVERDGYVIDSRLESVINLFSKSVKANMFVTDLNGKVLICSEDAGESIYKGLVLKKSIVNRAIKSQYSEYGTFEGLFKARHYVVGVPIQLTDETDVGLVFAAADAVSFDTLRKDIGSMFLIYSVLAALFSFVAFFIMTYKMIRPLREMAQAANSFGKGDFSRRLPVNSDDVVGQLALAFNNMAISLSSSENMRRSFIANVSHELKTPMTTIGGFIDGILDGTIDESKRDQYLRIVSDEVKRLSRLVKSMLDLSRIDAGELGVNICKFNINEIIYQTFLSFEQKIISRGIRLIGLEKLTGIEVEADIDLLHQVVYNLAENAVKFTNEQGTIEVLTETKHGNCCVTIRNTGMGIPAEELPQIFERFYKTDKSRSIDKKGMGLGLYLTKTIISLHHGEITVSSKEGSFCEFTFFIPQKYKK